VCSNQKMLAWPLKFVACAGVMLAWDLSLRLYAMRSSRSTSSGKTTATSLSTRLSSPQLPARSYVPPRRTDRERAIDGFVRAFAERASEGEEGHANYLANQVFRFNEMTDEEFIAEFAN
jgi:hypothetical protein